MAHYDSTREYDNKKELAMIRFIIPISSSMFRIIEKFEYNVEKDIIEINADGLNVEIGAKNKIKKGKPSKHQKSILVKIKLMYDKWEEYL
jgi:hypothetical protein